MDFETTSQLAKRLGKNPATIWVWINRGVVIGGRAVKLAARRIGKQWAIAPDDYEAFVKACNPGSPVLPESPAAFRQRGKRDQERVARKLMG